MKDTSAVLDSLKQRIEAFTPTTQDGPDDRFHVLLADPAQVSGPRDVRVTAMAGRQRFPGKNLTDWETQVEVKILYPDVMTDPQGPTVMQQAITDAESLLADLYCWAVTTDGITQIYADLGQVVHDGTGLIITTRTIRVEYTRG